jgi:hypothetical protein
MKCSYGRSKEVESKKVEPKKRRRTDYFVSTPEIYEGIVVEQRPFSPGCFLGNPTAGCLLGSCCFGVSCRA